MQNEIELRIRNEISEKPIFLISRLKDSEPTTLHFNNKDTSWVDTILQSITAEYDTEENIDEELKASLTVKRDSNSEFGEYLIVTGSVEGKYMASCVKCLDDSPQSFSTEFQGVYIHSRYENDPEYEEVDDVFIEDKVLDLYFHERGKADLSEALTEAAVLAINPYPKCKEECKGLCGQCGENKNHNNCGHH